MKSPFKVLLSLSLALLWPITQSADLAFDGSRLLVSGMLDGTAIEAFKKELATGRVRTVVFEDSLGGVPEVAREYARAIQASGVDTEVQGQCHAACAYAFLAGRTHRFGHGFQVDGLLIPVGERPRSADLAHRWDDGRNSMQTLSEFIVPATKTSAAPKERWQANQGVLFTSTPTLFGHIYSSFYCDGTQGSDMSRCEPLADTDPFKLGVLTP
jgi:hypothetical protein